MEERTKREAAIVLSAVVLLSLAAGVALTQRGITPTLGTIAPLSSAYMQYLQNKAAGKVVSQTPDGYGLGYVPPPIQLSKRVAPTFLPAQIFPATYDLRTLGKVSPVEDQNPCGTCWDFATFGSLESYLLPTSTTQFSENNLKNGHDFNEINCCPNSTGNAMSAAAYLARWGINETDANGKPIHAGPVSLSCDPYDPGSCTSPATCPLAAHVQNVYFLPLKTSPTDNNVIKSAIMTYGGVWAGMDWVGPAQGKTPYYNATPIQAANPYPTAAYYENTENVSSASGLQNASGLHAVTIVGWDDNYAATNFSTPPPGNGAFIVKNSWGTSFGQSGFFYVSYYDISMGHVSLAVFTAEPTTNYQTNYQYDPFGLCWQCGASTSTAYGANVFTATSDGALKAISFWAVEPGTQYTANVYVNPAANDPASGTLSSTISGTVPYTGYYTEPLNTTVPLTTGETFSVVIQFTTPAATNDPLSVPLQVKLQGYDDAAPTTPTGVSFVSPDGHTWTDVTTLGPSDAVCIHAFA
ncbi:MAG TPA: lectin like domain-containing protein [Candidatus Acidoferrales bacterium]|nr:lectin like domain-containing protein [Candidatus Acidoferrales bacterium]